MYELYVCESTESACTDAQCAAATSDSVASGAKYFVTHYPFKVKFSKEKTYKEVK